MKQFKVIWERDINVHLKQRMVGAVFQGVWDGETKNLVNNKYLEVSEDEKTKS